MGPAGRLGWVLAWWEDWRQGPSPALSEDRMAVASFLSCLSLFPAPVAYPGCTLLQEAEGADGRGAGWQGGRMAEGQDGTGESRVESQAGLCQPPCPSSCSPGVLAPRRPGWVLASGRGLCRVLRQTLLLLGSSPQASTWPRLFRCPFPEPEPLCTLQVSVRGAGGWPGEPPHLLGTCPGPASPWRRTSPQAEYVASLTRAQQGSP